MDGLTHKERAREHTEGFVYRLYTENKPYSRANIEENVACFYANFTILEATGHYMGDKELSLVIEIITSKNEDQHITKLAERIRKIAVQHCVLISRTPEVHWLTEG